MTATPPDPFTCPVCDSCDHDIRGAVLEFLANVQDNLKLAGEDLLDAIEAEGDGAEHFGHAVSAVAAVKSQLSSLIEFAADIALVKAVNAE
jgi:hypothetical protein